MRQVTEGATGLRHPVVIAGFAALVVRIAFVWLLPYDSGDWVLYGNVAQRILEGCGVAVRIGGAGPCVAHFGGNQLPLYPAFAAAVWAVSAHSDLAIRVAQSVLAAAAIAYAAHAVLRLTRSRVAAAFAGLALAASPVTAIFAGSLLTETLAVAATTWVLAELLLSLAERRLRVLPLGLATLAAVWVRMDGVLLLAPVAALAWLLAPAGGWRRVTQGARGAALVTALVAAPCLAWSARDVAVGIPALPLPWVKVDGSYWGAGYTRWVTRWVVGQEERGDALYYDLQDTRHFCLPAHAFADARERDQVTMLVARARLEGGSAVPADVDAAFAQLAAARDVHVTIADRAQLFLARARALAARWVAPWSADVGDGRDAMSATDLYRFALVAMLLVAAGLATVRRDRALGTIAALGAGYAALRVAFFAAGANTELRYLVEVAPFLETNAALATAAAGQLALARWRRRGPAPGVYLRPQRS